MTSSPPRRVASGARPPDAEALSASVRGGASPLPEPYYDDGQCVIYHARCEDVLPALSFAAIVTDPPYGMAYQHGARKGGVQLGQDGQSIAGDDVPFDPAHILAYGVPTVMWGGNHYADRLPPSRGWLVWDKRDGRPSNDQSDCELAWTNLLNTARLFSRYWSGAVRTGREQTEGRLHVNQKPVALMAWCLGLLDVAPGVVVDPYMGSGSTLVAARELGIPVIGIELDEAHCANAVTRFRQGVLDLGGVA